MLPDVARGAGDDERLGDAPEEVLQGTIERVTYSDERTLYSVLRISPEPGYEISDGSLFRPTRITAVGRVPSPGAGQRVRLAGHWESHRTHGRQFAFEEIELLPPTDAEGLARYLAGDSFPGIGETLAKRIVKKLGPEALERIREEPGCLDGIRGLRPDVAATLAERVAQELVAHKAHAFLRGLGLGPAQAATIVEKLGVHTEDLVRRDPYQLAGRVPGIGFGTADRVARALGLGVDDPRRTRAGLLQALRDGADEGHSCLGRREALAQAESLLAEAVSRDALEEAVETAASTGELVVEAVAETGEERLYLPQLHHCESMLARNLVELLRGGEARPLATAAQLAAAEERAGLELHADQRAAVLGLLAAPVALLTGGPGVGKTTIVRLVVALAETAGATIALASPTGRAAKRLAEATGRDASTVHRLLGWNPAEGGFERDSQTPLDEDVVIVDEISMLDVALAHHLVKAVPTGARLLLVGDPDQLPSVGPGNVLADLIGSGSVPVHRLQHVYRQSAGSLIITNAHRILRGELPELPERGDRDADFYFFPADDPEACAERVVEVATERIPKSFGFDWMRDVQVISPMYRGPAGVDALNDALREALHAGREARGNAPVLEIVRGERTWREGDRVIHTRNDYEKEVFNGDMGRIVSVSPGGGLRVAFPEREVDYTLAELGDLRPAFAITVHRSQGGEFPVVVIPLVTQHYMMLQRNLLYTAVTRARRLVVLVGSLRAVQMAVENASQRERNSALGEKLRALAEG